MRRAAGPIIGLIIVALGVTLEARRAPAVFTDSGVLFTDPDDYMRVYRAREIMEGRTSLVRQMPEINSPVGATLHWTAPMDYLIVAAAKTVGPLFGDDPQVRLDRAAAWLPVMLGAIYVSLLTLLLQRATSWSIALTILLVVVVSPAFHRPFALGHPDHHCLLELLFMLGALLWLPRRTQDGSPTAPSIRAAVLSGTATGLALWVAPQAMAVWLAILCGATIATFRAPEAQRVTWATRRFEWGCVVFFVVATGFLIENWPTVSAAAADKVSVFHVALTLLAFLVPSGAVTAARKGILSKFVHGLRHWTPMATGLAVFAVWALVQSDYIFGDVVGSEFIRWSAHIVELQPLWTRTASQFSLTQMHLWLGFWPYVLPIALWFFVRGSTLPVGPRMILALSAAGFATLAIVQRRWLDHAFLPITTVAIIGLVELARRIAKSAPGRPWLPASLVAAICALLTWPSSGFLFQFESPKPHPTNLRTAFVAARINEFETRAASPADRRAILCEDGEGPMLLYRTRLPIVAAPYHRAMEGIVAAAQFYAERDELLAVQQLEKLGVRYVVVPFRPHEQLMNHEFIAYGELRSYEPPIETIDEFGLRHQELRYKPEISQSMAYRLAMQPDQPPTGLRCIARIREGAQTPDGYSGLLYVETTTPIPPREESEL
ncbi:hypothetical protein B7486_17855 [cyanobacterium TDX16]|nr:hypothetical protein B7486_17855 [cyanobacterium TDX16]